MINLIGRTDIGSTLALLLIFVVPRSGSSVAIPGGRTAPVRKLMQVARRGKSVAVTFAPVVLRAVHRYFPGYRVAQWHDYDQEVIQNVAEGKSRPFVPFAVTGDFDGNRLPDIALMLKNRRDHWLLVALHQRHQGGFRPYRLARLEPNRALAAYIECHPPGRLDYLYYAAKGKTKVSLIQAKHDWIEEADLEATANTGYYFKRGRYRPLHLFGDSDAR